MRVSTWPYVAYLESLTYRCLSYLLSALLLLGVSTRDPNAAASGGDDGEDGDDGDHDSGSDGGECAEDGDELMAVMLKRRGNVKSPDPFLGPIPIYMFVRREGYVLACTSRLLSVSHVSRLIL